MPIFTYINILLQFHRASVGNLCQQGWGSDAVGLHEHIQSGQRADPGGTQTTDCEWAGAAQPHHKTMSKLL